MAGIPTLADRRWARGIMPAGIICALGLIPAPRAAGQPAGETPRQAAWRLAEAIDDLPWEGGEERLAELTVAVEEVLGRAPSDPIGGVLLLKLGQAWKFRERPEEALPRIERAIRDWDAIVGGAARLDRAAIRSLQGRHDEAEADYKAALAWTERDPWPLIRQIWQAQKDHPVEEDRLARLVPAVEAHALAHPADFRTGHLLLELAAAWVEAGAHARAQPLLDRLLAGWPGDFDHDAKRLQAEIHAAAGRDDLAAQLGEETDRSDSRSLVNLIADVGDPRDDAHAALAGLAERRGDWRRALEHYEAWRPSSFCGNAIAGLRHERSFALARCRFHLDDVPGALDLLWDMLAAGHCINEKTHPRAAMRFVEYAARAHREAEARARMEAELTEELKAAYRTACALGDAIASDNADRIVDALQAAGGPDPAPVPLYDPPEEWEAAAEALKQLGDPAARALDRRIRDGDVTAATLAALADLRSTAAAIAARRAVETDDRLRERLDRAIEWLGD